MRPTDETRGTLQDIGSSRRLKLIWETNLEMALGHAQHKEWNDPRTLTRRPAAELVRISNRRVPRDWPARWRAAMEGLEGGAVITPDGRMIARLDSLIWAAISRFGLPYPPFDFNSGMGMERLRLKEAVAAGVMKEGEVVKPVILDFNSSLSQKGPESPEFLAKLASLRIGAVPSPEVPGKMVLQSGPVQPIVTKYNVTEMPEHPEQKRRINFALAEVNKVMSDGPLPMVTIRGDIELSDGNAGVYNPGHPKGPLLASRPAIGIDRRRPDFELTVWHEVGHWIFDYGFADAGKELAEFYSEVGKTERWEEILTNRPPEFDRDYSMKKHEVFSRAYSQFIAEEAGNRTALGQIAAFLAEDAPNQRLEFWESEDFKRVRATFRKIFQAKGWLSGRSLPPLS